MSDIMEKTLNSVSNFFTGNLDISLGFDNLLRTVTHSSKVEVDNIIAREIVLLKKKLSQPDNGMHKVKEYLVRLLYCEMLGHDTSECHIHAVKLAQQASLQQKQMGYLAICILLHEKHELLVLMVNTFQRDLQSSNFLEVCMALTAVSYLGTPDMVPVLLPHIQKHISHQRDVVRKKAAMTLFSFYRKSPMLMVKSHDLFKKVLCDSKPSVMAAGLHVFKYLIQEDCEKYKDIVPSLVKILHQIVHHKLHQDFEFHSIPAPWTQINILKMMALLGQGDTSTSALMQEVLYDVLQQSKQSNSISYALQYECIVTITRIECSTEMLTACSECIDKFLKSTNHNLKYLGINALSCIVQVDAALAVKHQILVIDCLNDTDDTIQIKTLELLFKMCDMNNVEVICNQYLEYLTTCKNVYIKKTLLQRVLEMANKNGQKGMWYIDTVNKVLYIAGDLLSTEPRNQIITQVKDLERWSDGESLHMQALHVYYELLSMPISSEALFQVSLWVVGEFWQPEIGGPVNEVLDLLVKLLQDNSVHSDWLVTSIGKILCKSGIQKIPEDLQLKMNKSNVETRQRIFEVKELCQDIALAEISSCEQTLNEVDCTLSFLDDYVTDALEEGVAPYRPKQQRHTEPNREVISDTVLGGLKFEPYQSPTTSLAGTSTSTPPKSSSVVEEMSSHESDNLSKNSERFDNLQLKGIKQVWSKEGYVKKSGKKTRMGVESNTEESSFYPPMSNTKHIAHPVLSPASATAVAIEESNADREKRLFADKLFGGIASRVDSNASLHDNTLDKDGVNTDQLLISELTKKESDLDLFDLDINTDQQEIDLSTLQLHDQPCASHEQIIGSHDRPPVSHEETKLYVMSTEMSDKTFVSHGAHIGSRNIRISDDNIPHNLIDRTLENSIVSPDKGSIDNIYMAKETNVLNSYKSKNPSESVTVTSAISTLKSIKSQTSAIYPNQMSQYTNIDHNSEKSLLDDDNEVIPEIPKSLSGYPSSSIHDEVCMSDVSSLRTCRVWKPDSFIIVFFLVNKSRFCSLVDVVLSLNCPSNLECYIDDEEISRWTVDNLPPGSIETVAVYFNHKSPSLNMNLGGQLCFRDGNKKLQRLFFSTEITLSDFIRPVVLTTEEFGKKWQDPMLEGKLNIDKGVWKHIGQVLHIVNEKLNFHHVEVIGQEAIASGSILGSSPCLLHISFNKKSIQLWFRTSSKLLTECLVQEATKHFK